jgi:hypothetical protein
MGIWGKTKKFSPPPAQQTEETEKQKIRRIETLFERVALNVIYFSDLCKM